MSLTITSVSLSECLQENRFSAEFFDPKYTFKPRSGTTWIRLGRALKACQYGISRSMNNRGVGTPILRMNEIESCFVKAPAKFAPTSSFEKQVYGLKRGDVLFNRTNSFEFVGRTGIVSEDTDAVFASYLIRLVPDPNLILPEFLTLYLNTQFGIGQVRRRAMPSINQANVSGAEVRRVLIPLLPMHEQQAISALLSEALDMRQQAQQLYSSASANLNAALGISATKLTAFATGNTKYTTPSLSRVVGLNRFDAQCMSFLGMAAESFLANVPNQTLGSLVERTAKGSQAIGSNGGSLRYASIKHIRAMELVTHETTKSRPGVPLAYPDDLLLAITGATIGKVGIVSRYPRLAFSGDLLGITAKPEVSPHYLLVFLAHELGQAQVQRWITGSTNGHLAARDVRRTIIPRFRKEVEQRIASLAATSMQRMQESERLLQQAKSRVEAQIEEAVDR